LPLTTFSGQIALREAKRRNEAYRPFAIRTLGEIAVSLDDDDFADTALHIVKPLLEELAQQAACEDATNATTAKSGREARTEKDAAGSDATSS